MAARTEELESAIAAAQRQTNEVRSRLKTTEGEAAEAGRAPPSVANGACAARSKLLSARAAGLQRV